MHLCNLYYRLLPVIVWHLVYSNFDYFIIVVVVMALKCPFLTRFPVSTVRQNASQLLQVADQCPIMGHVMKYFSSVADQDNNGEYG